MFDGTGKRPWSEEDPARPLSAYGASKFAGEKAIRAAHGPSLIVRTSWIYASKGANFFLSIAQMAQNSTKLRVVSDQFGAPTSAALVADAIARMLAKGTDNLRTLAAKAKGLVHLAASGEASWHLFATEIVNGLRARGIQLAAECVVPIRSDEYSTRARRPHNSRLSLERLQAVFGITTPHWTAALVPELDDLVREMVGQH